MQNYVVTNLTSTMIGLFPSMAQGRLPLNTSFKQKFVLPRFHS